MELEDQDIPYPPEPNDRPHRRGTLSMAKIPRSAETTRDPTDNGSQFFICVEDSGSLDRNYTAFGKVVRRNGRRR